MFKFSNKKLNFFVFFPCSPLEPHKDSSPTAATANSKQIPTITVKPSLSKSKTQISSIYTKLSSIKPTANASSTAANLRSSSIPNYLNVKPVKTTQIGNSQLSPSKMSNAANTVRSPVKSPKRIPQLVKPTVIKSSKSLISFMPPKSDDSNGNSATSSLSTSSSNSSLNTSPVRRFV